MLFEIVCVGYFSSYSLLQQDIDNLEMPRGTGGVERRLTPGVPLVHHFPGGEAPVHIGQVA